MGGGGERSGWGGVRVGEPILECEQIVLGKILGSYGLECKICFWAEDKTSISESYNLGNISMVLGLIHTLFKCKHVSPER